MPWCYNPFFGSSPRVRGKQIARLRFHEQGRIIPARAGQTRACRRCHPPFPDHPRACGANGAQQGKQVGSAGSSPRVRGKRPCVGIGRRPRRIIPARAGQTMIVRIGLMTVSDHPRACGANMGMTEKLKDKYGSSPRVRGKRTDTAHHATDRRIIPARAGQTDRSKCISTTRSDHPRACGANLFDHKIVDQTTGSSPRVRGKHVEKLCQSRCRRIIPARAGQTRSRNTRARAASDHPRACGANTASFQPVGIKYGSSPRVRGKPTVAP